MKQQQSLEIEGLINELTIVPALTEELKLIESERIEQIQLLSEQRQMIRTLKLTQKIPNSIIKKSNIQKQKLSGPYIPSIGVTESHPQSAIQDYIDRNNFDYSDSLESMSIIIEEEDSLSFIRPKDIEQRLIMQKGSYDGGSFKITLSGTKYAMKLLTSIKKDLLDVILGILNDLLKFSHPCLRKSLAYLVEPITTTSINLGLIHELNQHNLYSLEYIKSLSITLQMTMTQRIQISMDIVGAVSYLHQQKYYHGNIKPSNILLNFVSGQVYGIVTDWEFCKNIYPLILDEKLSQYGWSAPEVYQEDQKSNSQSDIWSIGMILLYIFYNIKITSYNDPYKQLELTNENDTLNNIVYSLIQKDPKLRKSLDQLLKDLQSIK